MAIPFTHNMLQDSLLVSGSVIKCCRKRPTGPTHTRHRGPKCCSLQLKETNVRQQSNESGLQAKIQSSKPGRLLNSLQKTSNQVTDTRIKHQFEQVLYRNASKCLKGSKEVESRFNSIKKSFRQSLRQARPSRSPSGKACQVPGTETIWDQK